MVDFEGLEGPIFDRERCKAQVSDDGLELILNHRYGALVTGLLYNADEHVLYIDMKVERGRENETDYHDAPSITLPKEVEAVRLRTVTYVTGIIVTEHPYARGYMPDVISQKRL